MILGANGLAVQVDVIPKNQNHPTEFIVYEMIGIACYNQAAIDKIFHTHKWKKIKDRVFCECGQELKEIRIKEL